MEIYDYDERLLKAFEIAGQYQIDATVLQLISNHKHTIYLKFKMDDEKLRENLLKFSEVIETIGGYAIKVENSGIAHEFPRWKRLLSSQEEFDFYTAMVILVHDENYFFSCGMHIFGLPDCAISANEGIQVAAKIISIFNMYLITESPKVESGQTFSISKEDSPFRLFLRDDFLYGDEEYLGNPYGKWELERI